MPEEGRTPRTPRWPAATSASTAIQLRRDSDLSTLLFPPDAGSPASDDEVHFRDLWHVIVKRKWSIIAFFAIATVATAIGTMMQVPAYRAEITIRIDADASKIIPFRDGVQFDTGDPDYFQTQIELLKSRALAERVVAQMKLSTAAPSGPVARSWWEDLF